MNTEMSQPGEAVQQACAVCGAPAHVWCHNDEASLCNTCDAMVHSASPLAMMHKRTPLVCAAGCKGTVAPAARECHMEWEKCPSSESCKEVCVGPSAVTDIAKTPIEQGSTEDDILRSDEFDDGHWNPPDLSNWLADESFEVNVLDLNSDLAMFIGSETQPWGTATLSHDACALPSKALQAPSFDDSPVIDVPGPKELSPCLEPHSSTGSDCCLHPQPPSPREYTPVATVPASALVTPTTTSSSGPARVPTTSQQSQDRYSPSSGGDEDSTGMPPHAAAPMSTSISAPSPPTAPPAAPPMPMMPYFMPQPMMDPSMMWAGGACFMPMLQTHAWATYMPSTLLPKADPAAHELKIQERRMKRARFLEKKHRLSCRKAVRYASRKRYADSRPRVNGRFISKSAAAAAAAASAVPVCGESA